MVDEFSTVINSKSLKPTLRFILPEQTTNCPLITIQFGQHQFSIKWTFHKVYDKMYLRINVLQFGVLQVISVPYSSVLSSLMLCKQKKIVININTCIQPADSLSKKHIFLIIYTFEIYDCSQIDIFCMQVLLLNIYFSFSTLTQ